MLSFQRFLTTKINFQGIKHRKIVHRIFYKYIPDNKEIILECRYLKCKNWE